MVKMIDTYLYEMEKKKNRYILEHRDSAACNLKKYFDPDLYKENTFEVFTSKHYAISSTSVMKELIEDRINLRNEIYGVKMCLQDAYKEIKKLRACKNAFLDHIADFCILAADILIDEKKYDYSEAFFITARSAELSIYMQLQDFFDINMITMIVAQFWHEYAALHY